jgi:hypothetical protein
VSWHAARGTVGHDEGNRPFSRLRRRRLKPAETRNAMVQTYTPCCCIESHSRDRKFWLKIFVVLLSPTDTGNILNRPRYPLIHFACNCNSLCWFHVLWRMHNATAVTTSVDLTWYESSARSVSCSHSDRLTRCLTIPRSEMSEVISFSFCVT